MEKKQEYIVRKNFSYAGHYYAVKKVVKDGDLPEAYMRDRMKFGFIVRRKRTDAERKARLKQMAEKNKQVTVDAQKREEANRIVELKELIAQKKSELKPLEDEYATLTKEKEQEESEGKKKQEKIDKIKGQLEIINKAIKELEAKKKDVPEKLIKGKTKLEEDIKVLESKE